MTPERIAEIRKRCDAATPGLWVVYIDKVDRTERSIVAANEGRFVCHLNDNMLRYTDDAEFIAAARQDVPDLLAAFDALAALMLVPGPLLDGTMGTRCRCCFGRWQPEQPPQHDDDCPLIRVTG